jgi:hypothetical protein
MKKERIYLVVPFPEKDEVKLLGAVWCRDMKRWAVPAGDDPARFAKWIPTSQVIDGVKTTVLPYLAPRTLQWFK